MTKAKDSRIPRFLSVTSKGGAGKSLTAQQICATWLLTRLGADAANLIELDDQNLDSMWLTSSAIKSKQIKVEGDASFAILDMFEEFAGKPFVLDLGNQTAPDAIKSLGMTKRLSAFDAIFVPVKDIGQDLINAQRTIDAILETDPDSKIVIALNGIMRPNQDPNDRRTKVFYGDILDYAEEKGFPLMIMPGIEGYGMSRKFGMTFTEIAKNADTMTDHMNAEAMKNDRAGDGKAARKMMNMIQMVAIAKDASKFVDNLHVQIDNLLGWNK